MANCPGCQTLSAKAQCLFTFARVIFISVQLQLCAESIGEVYIKSTETGQFLAMDTDGLLYGSVSMRLTCFQTQPRFEVSRNLVTWSDANYKAPISLCLLFFPAGFPPSTLPYFRHKHKSFLRYSLKILQHIITYYHKEKTLIEILVTHPVTCSRIPNPTSFIRSFIPKMLPEHVPWVIQVCLLCFL